MNQNFITDVVTAVALEPLPQNSADGLILLTRTQLANAIAKQSARHVAEWKTAEQIEIADRLAREHEEERAYRG